MLHQQVLMLQVSLTSPTISSTSQFAFGVFSLGFAAYGLGFGIQSLGFALRRDAGYRGLRVWVDGVGTVPSTVPKPEKGAMWNAPDLCVDDGIGISARSAIEVCGGSHIDCFGWWDGIVLMQQWHHRHW